MSDLGFGWFSRRRALRSDKAAVQAPSKVVKSRPRSRLGIMALEPRIMYDAAAAATAGAAAAHHDGAMDHAAIAAAEQHAPPATPSNTGHVEAHHHNGTEPASLAQTPNVQTPAPAAVATEGTRTTAARDASDTATPAGGSAREIVFIDPRTPDAQILASGVKQGITVVLLDADKDGLTQIADYLSAHPDPHLATIDIVGHGENGMMFLGSTALSTVNAADYAAQFATIGHALQPGGDLMLYGCEVAENTTGAALLAQIADATGVDVAASTGLVGSAARGGSWTLDAHDGDITSSTPFTARTLALYSDVLDDAPPVGVNDTASVVQDATVAASTRVDGVLGNDTDPDAGDAATLTVSAVTPLSGGEVAVAGATVIAGQFGDLTINPDGSYSYAANRAQALADGAHSSDVFTYKVADTGGLTSTATLTIDVVGINDVPVISGTSTGSVTEDVATTASGALTIADADTGQNAFAAAAPAALTGTYGTFTFDASGAWTYTLDHSKADHLAAGTTVTDTLTVQSLDASATRDIVITIAGSNDAPVVTTSPTQTVAENDTLVAPLTATDVDSGSPAAVFSISGGADASKFTIADGKLMFSSAPDFEHPASSALSNTYVVQVSASDGTDSTVETITVQVTDINDTAPVITTAATQSVAENVTLVAALTSTDADTVGTSPATFAISGGADAAKFEIVAGNLQFVTAPDFEHPASAASTNSYTVEMSAFDGVNTTAKTLTVNVTNVNEAPTAIADAGTADENETKSFDVTANDTDPDLGDSKALSALGAVSVVSSNAGVNGIDVSGLFSIVGNQIKFTPGSQFDALQTGETATVVIGYTMKDGGNLSSSSDLTLTITGSNDAPVATVAPSTPFSATEQVALDLKTRGLSVSDVDGGSGSETVTLSVIQGRLDVSAGGSGATVMNSGSSTVTITGTLAEINALLNSDGSSSVSYIDNTDAPAATDMLTLSIADSSHVTGSASSVITLVPVNDAPVAAMTSAGYSATENTSLVLKGTGLSVGDVDDGGGIETVTLSVGEGKLTVTAGDSGVATVSNSGTSTVTITGTITQINALLGAGSTSTLSYVDSSDTPSASTVLTLSINDGGHTGSAALTATVAKTITIAAVDDAPVAAADSYSLGAATPFLVGSAAGVLSNDIDAEGQAMTAVLVGGPAHGTLTLGTDGSFTYTPTAGYSGSDSFTYKAVQGLLESTPVTVALNVVAALPAVLPADQYWITTAANTFSNDPATEALIAGNTRLMVTTSVGGSQTVYLQDTGTSGVQTPLQLPDHIVIDYANNLYFITAYEGQNNAFNTGSIYVGHLNSAIAPTLVYHNPDTDVANGAAIIDLAIDPNSHTLFVSQDASFETGTTANNGIFSFSYNVGTGALSAAHAIVTYSPRYADAVVGIQTNYMSAQPINGILYYQTVNYTTWDGTFQIYALNVSTGVSTALMPSGQFHINYHDNSGQFLGDMDLDTANSKLYFTAFTTAGAGTSSVYNISVTGPAGTNLPNAVALTGIGTLKLQDIAYNSSANQLAFTDPNNQRIDLFTVGADDNTLTFNLSFGLGLQAPKTDGSDPDHVFGTTGAPYIYPTSIFFTPADKAPVLTTTTLTYGNAIEQVAMSLKNTITVSDPDAGNATETVTLTVDEGTLTVTTGGSGAAVSGSGTKTVTITGTLVQINNLLGGDTTSVVNYIDNTDTPSSHAALTMSINDGKGITATKVALIVIAAVNDAPVAAIAPPSGGPSYSSAEQVALDLKSNVAGKGLSIGDSDDGGRIETVTLSVGEGVLNVTAGGSGAGVSGSGTASVTITGTVAQINALLRTDGTSTVAYFNSSDTPSSSTILTLQVNDRGNTGTGGAKTAAATIAIAAADDVPVAVADLYAMQAGTLDGTSVLANDTDVDTPHGALTAVLVSGPAHLAGSGPGGSAAFTLNADGSFSYTPDAGFSGSDYFTYKVSDGTGFSNTVTVTIQVAGSPITATNDPYSVDEDGTLTIGVASGVLANDTDTAALPHMLIAAVLTNPTHGTLALLADGSFSYTPDANFYGTDSFTYRVSDDLGNVPAIGTVSITVAPVNDAPVLSTPAPATVDYVENAVATPLFAGETISDVDTPASFSGGTLTVAITSGAGAGDQIVLLGASGFTVAGGELYDGIVDLGAFTGSATSFSVALNGNASPAEVNRLARAFGFSNTTDNPVAAVRSIQLTFNDDGNVGSGAHNDVSVTQSVNVTPVNDAPVVGAGHASGYTEQAAAIAIDNALTVTDVDSSTLLGATIAIDNYVAGDVLDVDTGATGITVVSNSNGVLVLTGAATLADYQAVLRQVTFANTSNDDPTAGGTQTTRTISWSVTDDTSVASAVATTSIAITAVNDAPTESVPDGLRGLPGAAVTITGIGFGDVDGGSGQEIVTFSAATGTFSATTAAGVTVDASVAHVVTLTGTIVDLNAFIADNRLTFTPLPGGAPTTVSVVINDMGHTGNPAYSSATASLVITGNTPPTTPVDLDGTGNAVQEGAAAGTAVGITASSTDADGDPLIYSIVGRGATAFQIDPTTGVVSVRNGSLIDYESNAGHTTTITVQASDGHGGVTMADFTIGVTDLAPSIPTDGDAATGGSISEGAATGDTVGITAASADINGGTVTFALSDDAGGRFTIDATTGVVTVLNATLLDYEAATSHQITVTASDGVLTSSQVFTIAVTDVAPTTPVDTDGGTGGTISEGAVNGAQVGIQATSTDVHGGTVTYMLVDDAGGRFAIDATTGVVTVADAALLDYETATSHGIVVRASDPSGMFADQSFTIAVTDVAPVAALDGDGATGGRVSEGAVNGDAVGISAVSSDVHGGTVTYSLANDAGGRFAIDAATGVITVADAALLDYETATSHGITVRTSDPSGLFTDANFTIAVTDVAPTVAIDADGAVNTVVESAASGSLVGITAASSDIHGGVVSYSLATDSSHGGFAVDATTGVVTVADASRIDFESSGGSYAITVRASDPSGSFTEQGFTIAVTDLAPSTPVDSDGGSGGTISEGAVNGAPVGIQATSTDVHGGTVTYMLVDDAGGRFAIDATTGVVTVADAALLDYETATSHGIVVRASDPSGMFADQSFTIAVTDVAPVAATDGDGATGGSVSEGAVNGDVVGITAVSSDVHGGTVTYSLANDAGGRFAIDAATGVITVADAALLDYETATSHGITVRTSDPSGLFTDANFTIAVTDVAPTVAIDADGAVNSVVEGAANGSSVGITAASSDIHGGVVSYSLATDSSHGGFAVDATTGVVTVADASRIDFESSGGVHVITVRASDPSGSFTEQGFTIVVTDVKPNGGADAFATDEDTPLAVTAAQGLLANDSDINGAALTAVLVTGPSHGTLQFNPDGSFRYLSSQDYNGADSFTYRTSDGTLLGDPVTVSLTIRPVNDAPVLVAGNSLSFDANTGKAIALASAIALHDVDDTTMSHARVAITAGLEAADDRLTFVSQNGIAGSYDATTGVLTLTGTASVADYQAALASVTFTSTTQRDSGRTIQWTVDDGHAQFSQSLPTVSTLSVSGIIVPPHVFDASRLPPAAATVPPATFTFSGDGFDRTTPPAGGDGFGADGHGFGYTLVHADTVLAIASGDRIQIDLTLSALAAALDGDVSFVTARLANGDPLPDWLSFDHVTGRFAGLPPDGMVARLEGMQPDADLATGALPPDSGVDAVPPAAPTRTFKVEVVARDSKGNFAVTVFTIELRPRSGKQGWNMDRNSAPLHGLGHAGLAERLPELAAIEAAVRDVTGSALQHGIADRSIRLGEGNRVSADAPPAAGRAGLSEQMASIGWRAMQAQRNALLASLQQGR